MDIRVDSGGTLTITTNKQCAKLPLGDVNSYYAPQGTKEYLSGITPTWVDNQDGTYTYTLSASESNLTGYTGQYEWMSIDPINFYVEDGVTYRTLITTKKEWDSHLIMRNHIVAKRDYVKQGVDGGGNENMPEGIQMSYRGEMSEEAQSNMDDAISQIDEYIDEYGEGSEATEEEKESALQELIDNVTEALTMAAE